MTNRDLNMLRGCNLEPEIIHKLQIACLLRDFDYLQIAIQEISLALFVCTFSFEEKLQDLIDWCMQHLQPHFLHCIFNFVCCTGNLAFVTYFFNSVHEETRIWGIYNAVRSQQEEIVVYLHQHLRAYSARFAFNLAIETENLIIIDFLLASNSSDYNWRFLFEFACRKHMEKYAIFCVNVKKYRPNDDDFILVCEYGNVTFLQFFVLSDILLDTLHIGLQEAFEKKQWDMVCYLCQHTKAQLNNKVKSIIWGFSVLGSPHTQRLIKYDEQKINDLQYINSQIQSYYSNKFL